MDISFICVCFHFVTKSFRTEFNLLVNFLYIDSGMSSKRRIEFQFVSYFVGKTKLFMFPCLIGGYILPVFVFCFFLCKRVPLICLIVHLS